MENTDITEFNNPSYKKIASSAGIKSVGEKCYDELRIITSEKMNEILRDVIVYKNASGRKTITTDDILGAIENSGTYMAFSSNLEKTVKR